MGRNLIRVGLTVAAMMLAAPAAGQAATTITVNTEADNAPAGGECSGVPGDCSIRQAFDKSANDDTVAIPAGHYVVTSQLSIGNRITVTGTGNPVIDGGHAVRVLRITDSGDAHVSGVTITGGKSTDFEGGSGIQVVGDLELTNSTVTDSDARNGGGVSLENLETDARARIVATTINGNRADERGGGIFVDGGDLTLINSTVTGNRAGSSGFDGLGGGIFYGGFQFARLYNATVVENTATGTKSEGGNLFGQSSAFLAKGLALPDYVFQNTIVAGGSANTGPNCGGIQPLSQGNNLVNSAGECGTNSGVNDQSGAPGIAALGNYGGPTLTRKLLPGSKAIDNGNSSGCKDEANAAITADQRGVPRPIGAHCDIGAVEFAPPLAVTGPPNSVTKASATITGDVSNQHVKPGTSHFEFGTSTAYGQTFDSGAVAAGASHDPRSQDVTGLSPGVLYHYRIVVSNEDATSFGEDKTFITPTEPQPGPGPTPEPQPQPQPEPKPNPKPHKPTVRAARASSGCVRARLGIRLSVHVSSSAKLRRVDVTVDGKHVKRTRRRRFSVQVSVRDLKPGMHVLRVVATDSGGRKTTLRRLFRRCRPPAQPAFTG